MNRIRQWWDSVMQDRRRRTAILILRPKWGDRMRHTSGTVGFVTGFVPNGMVSLQIDAIGTCKTFWADELTRIKDED